MRDAEFIVASDPFRRALNFVFSERERSTSKWTTESSDQHIARARDALEKYVASREIAFLARALADLLTALAKALKELKEKAGTR